MKMNLFEKGPGILSGLKDCPRFFSPATVSTGIIAAIMGTTGPLVMVLTAAQEGMLPVEQAIAWVFSIYFFGGVITLLMALWYKQPICGALSIPGLLLVGVVLSEFSINEAVGAYMISGFIVLLLGLSGYIKKVMLWLPQPIIMGMIAGAMLRFGIGIADGIEAAPLMALITLVGWLLLSRFIPRIPGVLGALVFGIITAAAIGAADLSAFEFSFASPMLFRPAFSFDAFLSIAIPLSIVVIGAENTQAMGTLMSQDYKPPVNTMIIISGIGGIVAGMFGGHNANIAGPMTAITAGPESGPKEGRYVASVVDGILFGAAGIMAGAAASFIGALPGPMINVIVGLAMIGVLTNAFSTAFSGKYQLGAFFALVIAASGVSFLKIAAPFWALLGGVLISLILEPGLFTGDAEPEKPVAGQNLESK